MTASHTAALALLTRSLREDNRLKQTYFARGGLIAFILLMLWASQNTYVYTGAPGLVFFGKVVLTNFFFITLTGLSYFASAVAEEKEEGTLGLLRMTNLGPLTILLGKSGSRLLGTALLLLVQLPFTLLAVTLGGVSIHQVLAAYFSLGAYIFFACNLALLFSVICERVGSASMATGFALLLFFFGPYWIKSVVDDVTIYYHLTGPPKGVMQPIVWGMDLLERASVYGQLESILRTGFAGRLLGFQVLGNLALGSAFFLLAWWGFDAFTRERRPGALARKMPTWRLARFGMPGSGRAWGLAVWWKDFFLLHGGWNAAMLKVAGFVVIVLLTLYSMNQTYPASAGVSYSMDELGGRLFGTFMLIFGAEMALGASRIFRVEIQSKTLAGLVGLPSSVRRIGYQKVAALLLSGTPALAFAAAGAVLVLTSSQPTVERVTNSHEFWLALFFVGTQGLLFLHVAVYLSLLLKRLSLAVAVAAMVTGNMLFTALAAAIFRFGPAEASVVVYHGGLLVLTALIHVRIGARITQLAAAEG